VPNTNGTAAAVIVEGDELKNKEGVELHLNGNGNGDGAAVGLGLGGEVGEIVELENGKHNGGGDARDDEFNLLLEQQKAEGALIDA